MCSSPLSFLGGIDTSDGKILDCECSAKGESVAGKVLCFPFGKGSTVGSYAMYQLRLNGLAPAAIVNASAEPIVATGAIIAEIPMIDGIDPALLRTGDAANVDGTRGTLELPEVTEKHVVTAILRNGKRILLLRRSSKVGSYRGQWAGVSGFIEQGETDEDAAWRELAEETEVANAKMVRTCRTQCFRDGDTVWCVHPFLFDVRNRKVGIDWEHDSYEWVLPKDLSAYPTVPGLQQVVGELLR